MTEFKTFKGIVHPKNENEVKSRHRLYSTFNNTDCFKAVLQW